VGVEECFCQFWKYPCLASAQRFFAGWFRRATHSRLKPMAEVAWMIRRHLPNILISLRHRITNAGLEVVNAMIQWVKRTAREFRNAQNFEWLSTYTVGVGDLYPRETR
jgi:transposase